MSKELMDKAIALWEERLNRVMTKDEYIVFLDLMAERCPLCTEYQTNLGCGECPIKIVSGKDYCGNTPYRDVAGCFDNIATTASLRKPVAAEVKFLKEVRSHVYKV